jgi:hypothetical protein
MLWSGPRREDEESKPMKNKQEKSDPSIVAKRPANKPDIAEVDLWGGGAELAEQREGTEGNTGELPYPIEVMAAFRRLIDAMRSYSMRGGNLSRFKKLEAEAEGFVKACQASSSLIAETVLDVLIFRA